MTTSASSQRAEKRALREQMRAMGLGYREIAAEFARRYRLRPRTAWREAYGWSLRKAAAQINAHTGNVGLDPGGISSMTGTHLCDAEQWPGPAPKEAGRKPAGRKPGPYLLAVLAAVYSCDVMDLIDVADREHLPPADLLVLDTYGTSRPVTGLSDPATAHQSRQALQSPRQAAEPDPQLARDALIELRQAGAANITPGPGTGALSSFPAITYRWIQETDIGDSWTEREVLMAAHEASDHAERAERRDIGDATLEQLRADVASVAHAYVTGEPFPLFLEMRRVRARIYGALDHRLWPPDTTELYFLLGGLNGLMSQAAHDLGYRNSAEELIRAGWAYATAIDHRPLMGYLRGQYAHVAYWSGRPRQAVTLATAGLRYLPDGQGAARLHLIRAEAAAKIGDADEARRAIGAAREARGRAHRDDLHDEIGGEFACTSAKESFLAGAALTDATDDQLAAIGELRTAIGLYENGPSEERSYGCEAGAHVTLAVAQLRNGELDAVDLQPVFGLSSARRIDGLPKLLTTVRTELARPRYQGSAQARDLDEQIEDFGRDTIVTDLGDLPASTG